MYYKVLLCTTEYCCVLHNSTVYHRVLLCTTEYPASRAPLSELCETSAKTAGQAGNSARHSTRNFDCQPGRPATRAPLSELCETSAKTAGQPGNSARHSKKARSKGAGREIRASSQLKNDAQYNTCEPRVSKTHYVFDCDARPRAEIMFFASPRSHNSSVGADSSHFQVSLKKMNSFQKRGGTL